MGLYFLCSHWWALTWLLGTTAATAAAATANYALVFLAGKPLLPITVLLSKFATFLDDLLGTWLAMPLGMAVSWSLNETLGFL